MSRHFYRRHSLKNTKRIKQTKIYHKYNCGISVPVVLFKITLLSRVQAPFTLQRNSHKQRGWGHNFHGNDFAAPFQADVGRGWLGTTQFLLQSLILKLSLTQQIPLSSPLLPHLSPSFHLLFSDSSASQFSFQAPPCSSIYPSVCRRGEKITETLHGRKLYVENKQSRIKSWHCVFLRSTDMLNLNVNKRYLLQGTKQAYNKRERPCIGVGDGPNKHWSFTQEIAVYVNFV